MNIRYTAALALVGWYLLVPLPQYPDAPRSMWPNVGSYDTAQECEADQYRLIERVLHSDFQLPGVSLQQTREVTNESECIATDDPRLAK
jgi:hypothetical protein